jgi:hypothetical protein
MKLQLLDTTLICVDCRDLTRTVPVMQRCEELVDFGEVKLLTSLPTDYKHRVEVPHVSSHVMYSIFMLKELYKYVDTEFMLVVQADGFILNPKSWNNEWKQYDYIGALFNQWDKVGNGGFSFRSTSLMEYMSTVLPHWDVTEKGADDIQKNMSCYEDGAISNNYKELLDVNGFKIAPPEVGGKFAAGGNKTEEYFNEYPFGFHGCWRTVDLKTGYVDPIPLEDDKVKIPDILDLKKII